MHTCNLLEETIKVLRKYGKAPEDVEWCGSPEWGWFTWEEFKEPANREYDSDYGAQKVARDLLVVGKDFWLERHEYDGSEWWEYKTLPKKPSKHRKPKAVMGGMWSSLQEIYEDLSSENNGD